MSRLSSLQGLRRHCPCYINRPSSQPTKQIFAPWRRFIGVQQAGLFLEKPQPFLTYDHIRRMTSKSSSSINPLAQTGFANAASYDKYRPSYPEEPVSFLLESLGVAGVPSATIIDLAAGTGKFTEILARRPENYNVIAIEPHDGMRAQLESKSLPNVKVIKGTAEHMESIEDESVDGVLACQAFHWFANMGALKEIYRVIKPDGVFGMIWNAEYYNSPQSWKIDSVWESKLRDLLWEFDDGQPRFRHEKWKKVFDEQIESTPLAIIKSADPLFGLPIGEKKFPFETKLTKEEIWNRFHTLSQIAILEGEELERAKKIVKDALDGDDVKTDETGKVTLHGWTVVAWTSKIPSRPLREGG